MKPRIVRYAGMWICGIVGKPLFLWSMAPTPLDAYWLWLRAQP